MQTKNSRRGKGFFSRLAIALGVGLIGMFLLDPNALLAGRLPQTQQPPSQSRTGFASLSAAEQNQALDVAMRDAAVLQHLQNATRTEVLLVERHQESKDVYARGTWPRRADVFIYHYDQDMLLHAIVDLGTARVDSAEQSYDVMPITQQETVRAVDIALTDAQAGAAIRADYLQTTGVQLARSDQLLASAAVFNLFYKPDEVQRTAAVCGTHRCAELFLSATDGYSLSVSAIVDLSAGKLVTVAR